jgi:hypothetical protein
MKLYEDGIIGEHRVFHIAGMKMLRGSIGEEYHPIFYDENKEEYYYPHYDRYNFHLKWVKHNPDKGDSQDEKKRVRQIRDALNKCKDLERLEEVARILGV